MRTRGTQGKRQSHRQMRVRRTLGIAAQVLGLLSLARSRRGRRLALVAAEAYLQDRRRGHHS